MSLLSPPQGLIPSSLGSGVLGTANTWSANQTFSAQLLGADGTGALPTYSFTAEPDCGLYAISASANTFAISAGGTGRIMINASQLQFKSDYVIGWSSGTVNSSSDIFLRRLAANVMSIDSGDSFSIGGGALASGTNVLQVANGTAPSSQTADSVSFFSTDNSAGNTIPSFYCEGTEVLATGQADSASSVRVKMRINGTVVTLLAI